MPTIEVTDEQLDRLEAVRDDVAGTLAGPYGHVRVRDAVEYLLDTYTPPEEHEGASQMVDTSAESPDADSRGELAALDPIGSAKAVALERAGYETPADLRAATVDELTEISGIGETLAERILAAVDDVDNAADGADAHADADTDDADTDGSADDDGAGRLDAMMNLLDEHDDKWHESDGDEPYEVELPDGSVETARTKDDVRGVLFRHY